MFNFIKIGQMVVLLSCILVAANGDAVASDVPNSFSTPIHEDFDHGCSENIIFSPLNDDKSIGETFACNEKNNQLVCCQQALIPFKSGMAILSGKLRQLVHFFRSSSESTLDHKFNFTLTSEELADLNATTVEFVSLMRDCLSSMSTQFCNHLEQNESETAKTMNKVVIGSKPMRSDTCWGKVVSYIASTILTILLMFWLWFLVVWSMFLTFVIFTLILFKKLLS